MLELFKVKGFKNFKNEITMDFSDVRDYKFNAECINNNLLGKVIVYGKNSVGKTNLGLAMFDIVSHLTGNNVTPGLYKYFLCVDSEDNAAKFYYRFRFGSDIVEYSYSKNEKRELLNECLIINKKLIFDFGDNKFDFSGLKLINSTLNLEGIDVDSYLKFIINNSALTNDSPLKKLIDYVSKMLWFRSLDENRFIGYRENSKDFFDFIFEEEYLEEFQELLLKAGVNEKIVVMQEIYGNKHLYFMKGKPVPFFKVASNGTKALYTFFYWYKTAPQVSLMFIDEFDAFYHYELSETIVGILEKMKSTQIILTSHNTNLLSNKIMRPDCYFILTGERLVSVANATNRELREGHNLEKLYKSGEFNV